jgi:hypothetical protein
MISKLGRLEVFLEPIPRQGCHLVQSAGLFEKVGGALDDFKFVLS